MNKTPAQQWSELSALYEEADTLPAHALPAWLAKLEDEGHPLLPQLRRMLDARERVETGDFLSTLPKLPACENEASAWSAGRRVGPYRLVRQLGEGGMAEVWLAERDDGAFKRQVAIKLPYPRAGRETFAARFDRERDILASLRHPHIAGLFDAGVTPEGQAWLALEYVEGQPVSLFCDEHRLGVRERVLLFRQVLLAVQHAHANLVIHRDLKPANILVTPQGEVRLLDFGIAKLLEAPDDAIAETELTRQAGRTLTPRYASPEQLTGLPLTTACDVYSLGVVFYELLCGERPYELKVESAAQLEHAILDIEPRAPSRRALSDASAQARGTSVKLLHRTLSPELDAIALRCLGKKPSARYSSVDALIADIDRWLAGEAVLARAPSAWYRVGKFAARHRIGVGLGMMAVLSLAAVATTAVVLGIQAREESARAVAARDFMLGLFKRADAEKARGADITARELMEAGRKDLLEHLNGQPRLQAELLLGVANIQENMGEYVSADSTYGHAARIYRDLGMAREEAIVHASWADNALRMGDPQRATTLLQQARNVRGRPADDASLNAQLAEVDGWISNIHGDPRYAVAMFEESRKEASKAFGPNAPQTMDALRGLIFAQRLLRNFDAALNLQQQLEAAGRSNSSMGPKDIARSDVERAELLYAAGHYVETLSHVERAAPRCLTQLGPNDEPCQRLLLAKAQVMLRLGMSETLRPDVPKLIEMSLDKASPALRNDALFLAFRAESALGDHPHVKDLVDRISSFGLSGSEVAINPALKIRALLALAEAELRRGRPTEAERWLARLSQIRSADDKSVAASVLAAVAKSLTGIVLLQQQRAPQALGELKESQQQMADALGRGHPLTRLFSLNTALGLEAVGQYDAAFELVANADASLRQALGPDAPTYVRVLQLRQRLAAKRAKATINLGGYSHPGWAPPDATGFFS